MFASEERHVAQRIHLDETRSEPIVDVMIVVRNGIGKIRELRFETRLAASQKTLSELTELPSIVERAMFEDALARFVREIEPRKLCVALFEQIDDTQRLEIVFEPAVLAHALVERILSGVSEWGMPKIVREANSLGQRLVQAEHAGDRAPDLCDFHRVRQSCSVEITLVVDEDLRLVDQPTKGIGVHDAIAITLKLTTHFG
jgi:hypothetical protein